MKYEDEDKDKDDCSVHAVSFLTRASPSEARFRLWKAGRNIGDGATDRQIRDAIRSLGYDLRRFKTPCRTIIGFAKSCEPGAFLVSTSDHVCAVIDGYLCDRPMVSSLLRIERVDIIVKKPLDF